MAHQHDWAWNLCIRATTGENLKHWPVNWEKERSCLWQPELSAVGRRGRSCGDFLEQLCLGEVVAVLRLQDRKQRSRMAEKQGWQREDSWSLPAMFAKPRLSLSAKFQTQRTPPPITSKIETTDPYGIWTKTTEIIANTDRDWNWG